jgi:hypothetical protein
MTLSDKGEIIKPKVLDLINKERSKQIEKWGSQNHFLSQWLMILAEEHGEAIKAGNELCFRPSLDKGDLWGDLEQELVQEATVALVIVQAIQEERRKFQIMKKRGLE